MFDAHLRRVVGPATEAIGARLSAAHVAPLGLTAGGWLIGVGACVAFGSGHWALAAMLWLLNRVLDGLDGPVARARGATDLGGFLDIVADFSVYAGFVVAVAVAVPGARVASVALLCAYYVSGTAFLALSSLLERRGSSWDDSRSLRFVGGLAEGAETIVVYLLFCFLPGHAALIAWLFTAAVAVTAAQRVALGVHILRRPDHTSTPPAQRSEEPRPARSPPSRHPRSPNTPR